MRLGPTRMSGPPRPRSSHRKSAVLHPNVLAEIQSAFPQSPEDLFIHIGRCSSTQKDVTICYNTFGDARDPCMLLIMGLSCTATYWDARLCQHIADAGFYVVRFDNRDVGLSTHFDGYPTPSILRMALPLWASIGEAPLAYTLDDMADDAAGLLRGLCIRKAHVVGCSMGGMIAQLLVLRHPDVVASLCLLSTSAGVSWPKPEMLIHLLDGPASPDDAQSVLDYRVRFYKALAGDMTFYEQEFRLGMWWDVARSNYHGGAGRQFAAIARSSDRSARLTVHLSRGSGVHHHPHTAGAPSVHLPVVVLHGGRDPLIPLACGQHLAECIIGSKLVVFLRMGHYFSKDMFKQLADEMVLNARSAEVAD